MSTIEEQTNGTLKGTDELDLTECFGRPGCYVLRMRGESMADAHILDGDLVIVDAGLTPSDGAPVVAHLTDTAETTLKFWHPAEGGNVRLAPGNGRMPDRIVAADRVQSKGVVIGVLRDMRPTR